MIAGQIRRLSSALEPLPGNNKCLGNQRGGRGGGVGVGEGRGGAWASDCSILEAPTTQRTVENSQLGDKKTKRRAKEISWPLATSGTNTNRELGGSVGVGREDVGVRPSKPPFPARSKKCVNSRQQTPPHKRAASFRRRRGKRVPPPHPLFIYAKQARIH